MIRKRRLWWELQEAAKEYMEGHHKKFRLLGRPITLLKLPRGFTCYHFHKNMSTEERLRFAVTIAMAQPKGAFEYDMLEIDHLILRKAK